MRLSRPRVAPLEPSDWSAETAELMTRFGGGQSPGEGVHNIFKTLAHHPALLKRWTVFGNHILFKSTLPPREREILILRIGWLCRAEYEWGQHVVIGKREGLSDEDIENIRFGPSAEGLDSFEATRPYLERHGKQSHSTATRRASSGSPAQMCARTVA